MDTPLVRPAFRRIAARYGRDGARPAVADAEARLLTKVKTGGAGAWGDVPMPGQVEVTPADAWAIIQWILARAR